MQYRGRSGLWRTWVRMWPAAVLVTSFALAVTSVQAVAMPTRPASASFAAGVPQGLHSAPLSRPAVKVPAGGGSGSGGLSAGVPKPVKEIMADRTATSSTWQNANGTLSVRRYLAPHFYKSTSGTWLPIDPVLAPTAGQPGWWHSQAGSFGASFGPADTAGGAEQLSVGGARIGFAPLGVADPSQAPQVSGATAAYDGLWPGANLSEQVLASGTKEDIVLSGPGAGASYSFRLVGATARPDGAGGLAVTAGGRQVGTVPPLTVTTQVAAAPQLRQPDGSPVPSGTTDVTAAAGARLSVAGGVVTVSVSKSWLAGLPASAFPVVIDPSLSAYVYTSQVVSVSSTGSVEHGVMQVGLTGTGVWSAAAYFPAPALPAPGAGGQPWRLASADFAAYCDSQCGLYGLGEYGLPTPANSYPTYSQIPASAYPLAVYPESTEVPMPFGAQDYAVLGAYLASRSDGWWIGMTSDHGDQPGTTHTLLDTIDPNNVYMVFAYVEQPPPTRITSPTSGSVLTTTTPTLTAAPVTDPDSAPFYDFRLSTSGDGTGTVADSGWKNQASWTVPPGSLHDGVTYYATVLDSITDEWNLAPGDVGYVPPAVASVSATYTVNERLGSGGPSPTDTVGSPPGGTSTPSQGAPSPGAGTASETVNMVTGNLSLAVGTPQMQALAGPAGITLAYDSASSSVSKGGNYGLTGQYYPDDGSHTFTGTPADQRTDSGVDAEWPPGESPVSGLPAKAPFMVRWTGWLTLPAGTWKLGGVTTGGMRVYLNGSATPVYDDWAGTATTAGASYGTAVAGAQEYQIEVDDWEPHTSAQPEVQLWAQDTAITGSSTPSAFVVPSGWLTPVATGVPPGWSLQADASTVQWTRADDQGSQVVLQGPAGNTAAFNQVSGVYMSPPGDQDHLSVDGNGHLQLSTSDDELYTFNPDGSLASMTTVADDRHPAALQYTYSGSPALLRTITDPVSGRAITLSYGGDSACPAASQAPHDQTGAQLGQAQGMLCQVSYWDSTTTTFWYNINNQLPQLAVVISPSGQTSSFAYDSDNRLADIRDGLANDYLASGQPGTPAACPSGTAGLSVAPVDTQVCYDSSGRVASVTQPAPTPGAPRPGRIYTYAPTADGSGSSYLQIAGFTPNDAIAGAVTGYAERTDYDAQSRVIRKTDSAGHTTTTVWAKATAWGSLCGATCGADEPIVTANPAGEQTSTVYDTDGNITDTYGPAPLACFSSGTWPAGVTPTAPVTGYLPVENPQGTTGCGVSKVPHTHNGYDDGITGLAATYWPNGQFAGAPAMHATGLGSQPQPQAWCGTGGGLCAQWTQGSVPKPAGSSVPIPTDSNGNWSLRLTGTINIPANRGINFDVETSQAVTVLVDGYVILHDGPDNDTRYAPGQERGVATDDPPMGSPGPQSFEVDFQGSKAQLSEFLLLWDYVSPSTPGLWSQQVIVPDSMLDPSYNLKTSTTDPDGETATTSYSNATIGPEYGLPTASTVGTGSSTPLTTTTTYQPPEPGSYLQRASTVLPAGNTTTYQNYGGTDPPVAAACGVNSTTVQGGQLKQQTEPDPGGNQALVKQFIYDAEGRPVGVRTGTPSDISNAPWQCTSYDSRGRLAQEAFPAANGAPARTVTYSYSVGGNPLVSSVSDGPSDTITSTVDLLGRVTSYTDALGQTTTTSYNQAGQATATSGPGGSYQLGYDPNSGQPTTTTVNGTLLATVSYDTAGRMNGVSYHNGTTAVIGYDAYGSQNGLTYNGPSGSVLAGDTVTRSLAGRESTETTSESGGPLTVAYSYDGAGRLTHAADTSGGTLVSSYSYAASPSCPDPNAGENTNRTSVTIGSAATSYCYNSADQLVSSTTGGTTSTSYSYNERGDQTDDNGTTYTWDSADRAATATTGATTVTSIYDAVDRVIQSASTASGSSTVRYSYAGYTGSPAAVVSTSNTVLQQLVALPGGVSVTLQPSGNTWSYTNLQGDTTATASDTGALTAGPVTYDPWGTLNPGQTAPANTTGPNTFGAYAAGGKLTNTAAGTVLLGARTFNPAEARFLSVDPVNGGCANAYTYAFGDPLNSGDLTGQAADCETHHIVPQNLNTGGLGAVARGILASVGIGINDASNLVLISTAGHRTGGNGDRAHGTADENLAYLQWVVDNLKAAPQTNAGIRGALGEIAATLQASFPCGGNGGGGFNWTPVLIGGALVVGGLLTAGIGDAVGGFIGGVLGGLA